MSTVTRFQPSLLPLKNGRSKENQFNSQDLKGLTMLMKMILPVISTKTKLIL
jgi:hypothetical protein